MANCKEKDGLSQASALSIVFGVSFDHYNKTLPHHWIKEAEKIVKKYQDSSQYWSVENRPGFERSCSTCRATARRTR